ncbi:MAG TPA: chemotaxis protein CheW [Syntrophomonadaceae bacterium]|nr:chemotaxis protein CheW [Syntrophomonadaceae bacterium]
MDNEIQLVVFKLKQGDSICEYALPITKVQEIIQTTATTRLPQSPDFVEGIISLRGKIIPIINLKKRFNLGSSSEKTENCSVVVEVGGNTIGIMVDEVSEVLHMDYSHLDPPPSVIQNTAAQYLVGIGKLDDRLLLLLDVDKIFSDKEQAELVDFVQANL